MEGKGGGHEDHLGGPPRPEKGTLTPATAIPATEPYGEAITEALTRLRARDLEMVARLAGASRDEECLILKVLGREVVVDVRAGKLDWPDGTPLSPEMKVIVLTYLLGADGRIDGRWISYTEVPSGALYYPVFRSRGLVPLLSAFGLDPARLEAAAVRLGGRRVARGDCSVDVDFFPYLRVNVTVWKGDDEVPASANILFDSAVTRTMPAEVLAHLAEELVAALIRGVP